MPVILITRPAQAAAGFARRIGQALGDVPTVISPLTGIEFADAPPDMGGSAGVILTSRNGVEAARRLGLAHGQPAYCVGRATADAAAEAGFQAWFAGADAGALKTALIAQRPATPLIHLRGAETRGAIAESLNRAGLETHEATVYRQITLPLSDQARGLLQGPMPVIVPLFSPRSAQRFAALAPFDAPLLLAAISPAVAEKLHGLPNVGFGIAARPDAQSMIDAVSGLIDAAQSLEAGSGAK